MYYNLCLNEYPKFKTQIIVKSVFITHLKLPLRKFTNISIYNNKMFTNTTNAKIA